MTLMLNNEEIEQALNLKDCLSALERAYLELAAGRAVDRQTTHVYLPHSLPDATFSFKSVEGGVRELGVLALRLTSDIVKEEKREGSVRLEKLPLAGKGRFLGLVQLFSLETGELLAIMPDGVIQQARVGLTSALGATVLSRKDSRVLGLIGSGGQARAHVRALRLVRPIEQVKVYSPNAERRECFARETERETGLSVKAVGSAEEATRGSDIVCSATSSSRPVLEAAWLGPGTHYNAIREFEVDEAVFEKADVVAIHTRFGGIEHYLPPGVENLPGVRREKLRDWSRYPDIGDLLSRKTPGRTSDRELTFFLNNMGTGVQFATLGYSIYRDAREKGLGREVPTDWFLQDIKP